VNAYRFGEFVVDSQTRLLVRGSTALHLSPKAFRLLELLVARAPAALSKQELQDRLWPDTFVVEANLQHLVGEVRTALGDDPRDPSFVRTVYGYGYAFVAPVSGVAGAAAGEAGLVCILRWAGRRVVLTAGEHVIGRDPAADVVIDSPSVSRRHAVIRVAAGEVTLEDNASKNGSWVGTRRVDTAVTLADRDALRIGGIPVTVRLHLSTGSTQTAVDTPSGP
jgi:DNA-binding winged helix-turn-helix (wHTH) protein